MFAWPSGGAPNYFAAGAAALFVALPELAGVVLSTLTTMQPVKKKGGGHDERGADQDFVFHFLVFVFVPTAVKIGAHSRT